MSVAEEGVPAARPVTGRGGELHVTVDEGPAVVEVEEFVRSDNKMDSLARIRRAADYDALPWCWSDQGDLKLQISGLANPADERVELASPGAPAADGPALPAASPDGCGDRERPGRSQAGPASARRGRRPAHGRGGRGPRPDDLARRARPSRRQLRRIGGNATSKPTEGSRVARVRVQHEAAEGRDATGPLRCQRAARGLSSSRLRSHR